MKTNKRVTILIEACLAGPLAASAALSQATPNPLNAIGANMKQLKAVGQQLSEINDSRNSTHGAVKATAWDFAFAAEGRGIAWAPCSAGRSLPWQGPPVNCEGENRNQPKKAVKQGG